MSTRPPSTSARGLVLVSVLLAGACASSKGGGAGEVAELVRRERYDEAVDVARERAAARPDDPKAQELFRDAKVALALELGRQAVFEGDPEAGLVRFEVAEEFDPENKIVQDWILKTRRQLAEEWMDRAIDLTGPDQLTEAEEAFEKVLLYLPDHPRGKAGLARVLLLQNYRAGQSKSYFKQGVRTFRDYLLYQARHNFEISHSYDRSNEGAKERRGKVDDLLVQERLAQAHGLEEQGLYYAARNEYRLCLLVDPEEDDARAGLDRMDRETRATRMLAEAEMHVRRGDFDSARELLDEIEVLTVVQVDSVGVLRAEIEDAHLAGMYERARTLERDYLFHEAVAAYDVLLETAPYYEDAIARRSTLEEFISRAEEYYAKALESEDEAEAAAYLRQIPILWPEYLDVEERLAELEKRLAEQMEDGADGEEP